jgi:hypothetical protein
MTKMFKGGKNPALLISCNLIMCCLYLALISLIHYVFLFNFISFFVYQTIRVVLSDSRDEAPFCLSMTSKMLFSTMNKLSMWELPVVLHMVGMSKTQQE